MRRALREAIPSMFHRRLVLLASCAIMVLLILLVATARLTLGAGHAAALAAAEAKLRVMEYTTEPRGEILDRRGRVLAYDEAGWDIAVHYSLFDGRWAHKQARAAAKSEAGDAWARMQSAERDRRIDAQQAIYDEQVATLWTLLGEIGGVGPEQMEVKKTRIVRRVRSLKDYLIDRWQKQREDELEEAVPRSAVDKPIAEERQHHVILKDVSDETRRLIQGFIVEAQAGDDISEPMRVWKQVVARRPTQRRYPLETMTLLVDRSTLPPSIAEEVEQEVTVEGVAIHLLGRTRKIKAEDLEELNRPYRKLNDQGQVVHDLGGYSSRWPNDAVGASGIERSMENVLRGTRGQDTIHLDHGMQREVIVAPTPGRDVQITIDAQLQARIQAIMSPEFGLMVTNPWHSSKAAKAGDLGKPLAGAAVVLDVETGEVLAAVSMPSMPLRLLRDDPDAIFRDPVYLPWVNRATSRSYQPGSTLKPFVLMAAATAGVHGVHNPIRCEGIFDRKHKFRHRCWIFKQYASQHGPLDGAKSLEVSCNVYYYTLGKRMGLERLVDWYGRFGLGLPTGCGVEESAGDLPDPETTYRDESINMGIGQGPVGWTPLQAAAAYAALARGGDYLAPTLIIDEHRKTPRRHYDLNLNKASMDAAMDGLHGVVYGPEGSGRHLSLHEGRPKIFNAPGVVVFGKTGTAQTGKYRWIDHNLDGQRDEGETLADPDSHGWFIALIQPDGADRPTHAIVVVSEFAGSGGHVCGPVVNQIIHAMQKEGYLPS